jgi:hypothetical protein
VSDGNGGTATSTASVTINNVAPTVQITAPADGTVAAAPATVSLTATATDDAAVTGVAFYRNGTLISTDNSSPYTASAAGLAVGVYQFTAVANDADGGQTTSARVTVRVTATLPATADSYVTDQQANKNFGTTTSMHVRAGSSGSNRWTYLKFDLASVPSITSATMRLKGAMSSTGATVVTSAYGVATTSWSETGITWNNKPASGGSALDSVTMANSTTAAWYEWDLTSYLQAEKAAGRNVVTIVLKNNSNSTPYDVFTSGEGTAANRPQLVVTP